MNKALLLKGTLSHKKHPGGGSSRKFPSDDFPLSINKLRKLKNELESVYNFWKSDTLLGEKKIVTVYYDRVIAKSNRIQGIFSIKNGKVNDAVIGTKFSEGTPKHIITYSLTLDEINTAIHNLSACIEICSINSWKNVNNVILEKIKNNEILLDNSITNKTSFTNCTVDAFYVEKIDISEEHDIYNANAIITLYDTGISSKELLQKIGINYIGRPKSIDANTFLLTPEEYSLLIKNAPYLIAMSVTDLREIETEDVIESNLVQTRTIPLPGNEPVIGVIDTQFDTNVYFSSWVEYKNVVPPEIKLDYRDFFHGTYVTSIIVDGPNLNPDLDDGCGNFRVRHFGVSADKKFSSYFIMNKIEELVIANPDIKVWNLSLGSPEEIKNNFISPEAYVLDKLQYKYDVVFVVAGTNKLETDSSAPKKIGAPADSVNSIVVNSVTSKNEPASYSRNGPVLSFYKKPDISYYGGDENQNDGITVYGPNGDILKGGTSFAAPWITRKMAYLIQILGLTKEAAKAILIDSSTGWSKTRYDENLIGYGIVPKRIEEIVNSKDDEIKFIINGISEDYLTYNYNIPVPFENAFYPYIARATLCYFTNCSRNQGIDYTDLELELSFGPINNKLKINSIKEKKGKTEVVGIPEKEARNDLRKWDNVKQKREILSEKNSAQQHKMKYENANWGIHIVSNERIPKSPREKAKFSVVVTLKEVNGKNRFAEFEQRCRASNWFVTELDISNSIDVYNQADAEIEFED